MKVTDAQALLDERPAAKPIPDEKLLRMYRDLVRARAFDQKLTELGEAREPIIHHPGLGQEAPTVASCTALNDDDVVLPYHRGWSWTIARGMQLGRVLAELLGRVDGYGRGRAGPHLADWNMGALGRSGIQGAHLQIAAGVGLASRLQGDGRVCLAYFGDGASNTGAFHEALNLAATWDASVVYICENNGYQFATPAPEVMRVRRIADRAIGYGIPGVTVDGNDAIAVYDAAEEAIARAREGHGPTLLECISYRWSDKYYLPDRVASDTTRPQAEIDEWMKLDAIERLKRHLMGLGALDEAAAEEIAEQARSEMEAAVEFAYASPFPTREELAEDIYA